MSPLRIEAFAFVGNQEEWVKVGEVGPNELPGTLANNLPDGTRDVYVFSCSKDDSHSEIRKLPLGFDIEIGHMRVIDQNDLDRTEVVVTLRRNDPPYRISLKTDVSPQRKIVRFTHK